MYVTIKTKIHLTATHDTRIHENAFTHSLSLYMYVSRHLSYHVSCHIVPQMQAAFHIALHACVSLHHPTCMCHSRCMCHTSCMRHSTNMQLSKLMYASLHLHILLYLHASFYMHASLYMHTFQIQASLNILNTCISPHALYMHTSLRTHST